MIRAHTPCLGASAKRPMGWLRAVRMQSPAAPLSLLKSLLPLAVLLACVPPALSDDVIGVVIAAKPLESGPAPRVLSDVVCGPLAPCARLAGAKVAWDAERATMTIRHPATPAIQIVLGDSEMSVGDDRRALGRVVELRGGSCYGPLAPVLEALGLRVHWTEGSDFLIANGVLTGIAVRAGGAAAEIALSTTAPTAAEIGDVVDPPRRYVDLPGIEPAQPVGETRYIYTAPLLRIRTGMPVTSPATTRVVADLCADAEAAWTPSPDGMGGALLLGEDGGRLMPIDRNLPQLTDVVLSRPKPGAERLRVKLDWQITPQWDVSAGPARITLTFPEVACQLARTELPLRGEFVERVSIAPAHSPPSTTLTLFLNELVRFSVNRLREGGAEVVFHRGRLQDQKIALDPGHGGKDKGGCGEVVQEKEVNLDVAIRTARRLAALGARAFLTRRDDRFIDLFERPEIARRLDADMFVSIHCNAMPRRNQGHGTETFYWRPESKCLGLIMQDSLVRHLGRADRGLKRERFVVIRKAEMPAVLVELMFLNNDEEEALMQQDIVRDRAADAIVEGLRGFVEGTGRAPTNRERAGLMRSRTDR